MLSSSHDCGLTSARTLFEAAMIAHQETRSSELGDCLIPLSTSVIYGTLG